MSRYSIDIRHLRYFIAIAEAGSFTRAANHLHIAQPALSQHVRNLEQSFGTQLLDRTARGVDLTADGRKLLAHARRVVEEMDRLVDAVSPGKPTGDVMLGLPIPVSPLITQPLLTTIQRDFGGITLHIREAMSAYLAEWLIDGRIDAAVLFSNQELPHIDTHEVCEETLYVVGPPGAFSPGETIPFHSLPRYPLIMSHPENGLRSLVPSTTQRLGVEYTIKFEIDVITEMKRFVAAGKGYTVLAPVAFYEDLVAGRLSAAPIVEPEIVRTWTMATRRHSRPNAACKAAMDLTEAVLVERTGMVKKAVSDYAGALH